MTLQKQYEVRVRSYAKHLAESQANNPDTTILPEGRFLVEMSSRYEKTCIRRYSHTVRREISNLETYGIGHPLEVLEYCLLIMETRLEVLNA